MEIFYCTECKTWMDWDEVDDVTPVPGYNAIDPPDRVFRCQCGRHFGEEVWEDYAYDDVSILIDLLNDKRVEG